MTDETAPASSPAPPPTPAAPPRPARPPAPKAQATASPGVPITVTDPGRPNLRGNSAQPNSAPPTGTPAVPPPPEVPSGWTGDQAAHAVCGMLDLALLPIARGDFKLYEQLKANPAEVKGWDEAAARLLTRFFPSAGQGAGVAGIASDSLVVAEGLSMMAYRRVRVIRQLKDKADRSAPPRPQQQRPAGAPQHGPPPVAGTTPPPQGDGTYRIPTQLLDHVPPSIDHRISEGTP